MTHKLPLLLTICLMFIMKNAEAQTFKNFAKADGLPDNYICGGVAIDDSGQVWAGTASGIAKLSGNQWKTYTTADGLADNSISCICADKNNNIWAGTSIGISRWNGIEWKSYADADGLAGNTVTSVTGVADGSVWIGTMSGLSHFNGSTFKNYTTADGLPVNLISCVSEGKGGVVWFGTWGGGAVKFDGTNFKVFTMSDSLTDNNISAIVTDLQGNTWIGTYNGLSVFNDKDVFVKNYRKSDGLFNNFIQDIKVDSKGNIWAGIFVDYLLEGAVSKFNGSSWSSIGTKEGLIHPQVIRLAVDDEDNIWIATGNGLSRLTDDGSFIENKGEITFSFYPNPAIDRIIIKHKGAVKVEILGADGKLFMETQLGKDEEQLNLDKLKSGCYFIQITDKQNAFTSVLFVK